MLYLFVMLMQGVANISGKWKANVKHGTAEEIYPNGDKFIGTYVEGQRTGKGKYIWKDGRYFDGQYAGDKKSGPGKIIWPNGRVYDGHFDEDYIHGPGVYFAENGVILKNQTWDKGKSKSRYINSLVILDLTDFILKIRT